MKLLIPAAELLASMLIKRRETVAVSESSAGGLISAALLAVPGASAYFIGGAVVYTRDARSALLGITDADMSGFRSASEPYAQLLAATVRRRHNTTWGLAETGAAGPSGNRYGDAAGHCWIAIDGPQRLTHRLATGQSDRQTNMRAFALAAIEQLTLAVRDAPPA